MPFENLALPGVSRGTRRKSSSRENPVWLLRMQFSIKIRVEFYEQLAAQLEDGIPLDRAVAKMAVAAAKRKRPTEKILEAIHTALTRGDSFTSGIAPYIPSSELALISAGDKINHLAVTLREVGYVAESAMRMNTMVRQAAVMPVILLAITTLLLGVLARGAVPQLSQMVKMDTWPSFGRNVSEFAIFYMDNIAWILIALAALTIAALWSRARWTGPWRKRFDAIPPWRTYRVMESSAFLMSVALLLKASVPLPEAIAGMRSSASKWMRWHLNRMGVKLRRGVPYAEALDTGLLLDDVVDQMHVYAEQSSFSDAMAKISKRSVEGAIKNLDAMLNVLKYVVMVVVAVLFVATQGASYQINMHVKEALEKQR